MPSTNHHATVGEQWLIGPPSVSVTFRLDDTAHTSVGGKILRFIDIGGITHAMIKETRDHGMTHVIPTTEIQQYSFTTPPATNDSHGNVVLTKS